MDKIASEMTEVLFNHPDLVVYPLAKKKNVLDALQKVLESYFTYEPDSNLEYNPRPVYYYTSDGEVITDEWIL